MLGQDDLKSDCPEVSKVMSQINYKLYKQTSHTG